MGSPPGDYRPAPPLTTVVVTYNSARHVDDCLRALTAESASVGGQVVVVDNASSDDTVERVRAGWKDVELVVCSENSGFAAACNRGAAASAAPLLLFLNPDTRIVEGSLGALLAAVAAAPQPGIYGGRTLRSDGSTEPSSCWAEPTLWSLFCFAAGLSTALPRSPLFNPEAMPSYDRRSRRHVDIVTGCLLGVRRELWHALGGFDEAYLIYGEDADLNARARALGAAPVLVPEVVAYHDVGGSSTSSEKQLLLYRGKATYLRRRWSPLRARLGLALLQLGVLLRAAPALFWSRVRGRHPGESKWVAAWHSRREWRRGWQPTDRLPTGPRA